MPVLAGVPSELDMMTLGAEASDLRSREGHRWQVEHVPEMLRVYVTLTPVGSADAYCLRLDFGDAIAPGPPSVTFCHPESRAEGRLSDWPRGLTEYFKTPPGNGIGWICNPWTREGRAHHAEWQSYRWRPNRAIWTVATAIQDILDRPGAYTGRAQ
jgi:hypothetical protein